MSAHLDFVPPTPATSVAIHRALAEARQREVAQAIDAVYRDFLASLPRRRRRIAADLALALELVPVSGVPWSRVFDHPAVLGLPALLVEGWARRPAPAQIDAALRAHMFARIAQLVRTRLEGGRLPDDLEHRAILTALEAQRDWALAELHPRDDADFFRAEAITRAAHTREASAFEGDGASEMTYMAVALDKQRLAVPAAVALARAAGLSPAQVDEVVEFIAQITLAQQYRTDVVRWVEDRRRHNAWPVLMLGLRRVVDPQASVEELRRPLHEEGVLVDLLEMSARSFACAATVARAGGNLTLARWAEREACLSEWLADHEGRDAGHAVAWARERETRRRTGSNTITPPARPVEQGPTGGSGFRSAAPGALVRDGGRL